MIKPYITIKVEHEDLEFIVTEAKLHIPRKGIKNLNIPKTCEVLNNADSSIYQKRRDNEYKIDDPEILKKLMGKKISRKTKYIGAASFVMALVTTASIASNSFVFTSAPELKPKEYKHLEKPQITNELNIDNLTKKEEYAMVSPVEVVEPPLDYYYKEPEILDEEVFGYTSSDKTQNSEYQYVLNNDEYQSAIDKYAPMYGVDKALISAKISQENPYNKRNDTNIGARGISQIESVWWGEPCTAYNFETGEYETVIVDGNKLYDPDYSVKLGCMILSQTYHDMYEKFVTTNVLTDSECIIAALTGYNKGGPCINKLIRKYGADYIYHRDEVSWGDHKYYEHVLGFLEDGTKITFLNLDGTESSVYVDNLNLESFTR